MAEKKGTIVIKKITVVAGGAHGGAWKVAFADFMTAMMAFFLVMWLLATQSEQTKKAISDYFSTPSVIEYEFNNYGVELTLEKLFLDLVNEPLKVFQAFVNPMDRTPNVMAMGMKKVMQAHITAAIGAISQNLEVTPDKVVFEIPDHFLFKVGTTTPTAKFGEIMDKVKSLTTGLEHTDIQVTSVVYTSSVYQGDLQVAKNVAEERKTIVELQIKSSLEHDSVGVSGTALPEVDRRGRGENLASGGYIKIEIRARPEAVKSKKRTSSRRVREKSAPTGAPAAVGTPAKEDLPMAIRVPAAAGVQQQVQFPADKPTMLPVKRRPVQPSRPEVTIEQVE